MKKIFKILAYFILTIIVLVIVLLVVAKLAENKITDIALEKVSESIEAPVNIDEVSLNLLRKFPLATIELNDVILNEHILTGNSTSISNLDTIANIKKLFVSVKSKPLLDGIIEIMKVEIDGATINYHVDTGGATNIDFLISSTDTVEVVDTLPSKPLNLTLTDLTVTNIVCNFIDSSLKAAANVVIPELKVKARLDGDNILASAKGGLSLSDCSFDNTNLYLMNNTDINFDVDYENDSVNIKELVINTDGAGFNVLGDVVLGETIKADIQLNGNNLILDELLKYAPTKILKEAGVENVSGILNLDATVKGLYSKTEMPRVDLKIDFDEGNIVTNDYPELKNLTFSGDITNGILRNNQSTQANFSSFYFETEKSKFDLAFSVLDIDNPKYEVKTDLDINVGEFGKFIPDSIVNYINGKINLKLTTKGELPDSIGDDFIDYLMANTTAKIKLDNFNVDLEPDLSVREFSTEFNYKPNHFNISNLNIDIPSYNVELRNTSFNTGFTGSINDISKLKINVKDYHIETKGAVISGYLKVKDLENPNYETKTKISIALEETKPLLPDSLISDLSGNITINIDSKAKLNIDSIADQAMEVAFKKSSFDLTLDKVTVVPEMDPFYKAENLSGRFKVNPQAITINNFKGSAAGVEFEIDSTEIWNTYEVLFQNDPKKFLTVQTKISLDEINNDLIGFFMASDSSSLDSTQLIENEIRNQTAELSTDTLRTDTTSLLPDLAALGVPHFLVRGKLSINKVEYEKNVIDDISLNFRFTDSLYVLDQFKFRTCGGELNTSILLNARGRFWEKPVLDIKNTITALDLRELLLKNDKYVQGLGLTHENINGILTSEFDSRIFIKEVMEKNTSRVRAEGHFTLENGRIYDYEPLVELSKIKILGGLKGLDKLDFNTLTTSVFMLNDKIFIPKTDVVTSSMDMSAFAMHSLTGDYQYHIKVFLGDVMTGKNDELMKMQAKQDKEDGEEFNRDGGLRLLSYDIDGKKNHGLDNKKARERFRGQLNKQKGFLKLLFNPLLVNFSTEFDRTAKHKEIIEKYGTGDKE